MSISVPMLLKKLDNARNGVEITRKGFDDLATTLPMDLQKKWGKEEAKALQTGGSCHGYFVLPLFLLMSSAYVILVLLSHPLPCDSLHRSSSWNSFLHPHHRHDDDHRQLDNTMKPGDASLISCRSPCRPYLIICYYAHMPHLIHLPMLPLSHPVVSRQAYPKVASAHGPVAKPI